MSGSGFDGIVQVPELPVSESRGMSTHAIELGEEWPIAVDRDAVRTAIIEMNRAGVVVCDRDYRIWEVDGAFLDMENLTREDVIGRHLAEIVGERVFSLRKPHIDRAFAGHPCRLRVQGVRARMIGRLFEVSIQPVEVPGGEVACVVVSVRDVSQFEAMTERLSLHEEIVRQTTDRISVIGTDFRYKFTNAANAAFYGMQPEEFRGLHVSELIGAERFDGRARDYFLRCFSGISVEYEHDLVLPSGGTRFQRVRMDPYREADGTISAAIVVMRDITEASLMEKELRRQAREDALTGLANRHALQADLEGVIARAVAGGEGAALLTIDLDDFKIVNDISGHSGGDALLCQIAGLLKSREAGGRVRCARLGGDEFAVVLNGADEAEALAFGNRLVSDLATMRFVWGGITHAVTASVGIALVEPKSEGGLPLTVFQLLNRADRACLYGKEIGGARAVVFRPDAEEMIARQMDIGNVQIISDAAENGRFQLYTMPILPVDGRSQPIREVLLRVVDEDRRVLAPAALIGSAERHGLMPRIDRWVVSTVLDNVDKVEAGTRLSINLSGLSVGDPEFKDFLLCALDRHPDAATRLCFEITETAAVRSLATAQALTGELRRRGCGVILDDFGSGLSSFAYLRHFPVDALKIDGAIIGDVVHDEFQQTVVAGLVAIAAKLGVGVIAEYVETAEMQAVLRDLGVTQVQGYHVGMPTPWVGYGLPAAWVG
ncbi:putative bifunctional diguanylate cyclase/phosphodiesterase [Stappia indica]|uniref:putative bifunctional diguanylate cyclase/phosphodiesterase n=1 Tax=Stappia indica TaxID=538381 RepID=UPI000830B54B|nr:EAL domain-containing protein [Stappia indica]